MYYAEVVAIELTARVGRMLEADDEAAKRDNEQSEACPVEVLLEL